MCTCFSKHFLCCEYVKVASALISTCRRILQPYLWAHGDFLDFQSLLLHHVLPHRRFPRKGSVLRRRLMRPKNPRSRDVDCHIVCLMLSFWIYYNHNFQLQCLTRMSANCKGGEFAILVADCKVTTATFFLFFFEYWIAVIAKIAEWLKMWNKLWFWSWKLWL